MKKEIVTEQQYSVDLNIYFLQKQMKHPGLRMFGNGGLFKKSLTMEGDSLPVLMRSQPNIIDFMT